MNLTFEQICQATFGASKITQQNGTIHFSRFSKAQIEALQKREVIFGERGNATTGIRVEFHTNSNTLFVQKNAPGRLEILVDYLPALFSESPKNENLFLQLPEGEHHITILLPCHTPGALGALRLDENASFVPHSFQRKFLFLGDSITQGASAHHDSLSYSNRVARFFDADQINWGVGGTRFFPETLEKPDFQPDAIFVAFGTNDYSAWNSMEILEENCSAYLGGVKALFPATKVYCISPIWRADGTMLRKTGTLEQVRDRIIAHIENHGFVHIDGYQLFPHTPEYLDDGFLHPNELGMSIYAEQLIRTLIQHHGF